MFSFATWSDGGIAIWCNKGSFALTVGFRSPSKRAFFVGAFCLAQSVMMFVIWSNEWDYHFEQKYLGNLRETVLIWVSFGSFDE